MKTITEFSGFQLYDCLKTREQLTTQLTQEGKTPEEITTSLGETFKMEGDKLKHFLNALEFAKDTPKNLKRVLVMTFDEKDKKPESAKEKDGHYYVSEFFFVPQAKKEGRFGKKGKFKGKKGKKHFGKRPNRSNGENPVAANTGGKPGTGPGADGEEKKKHRPRRRFFKGKKEGDKNQGQVNSSGKPASSQPASEKTEVTTSSTPVAE